MGWGCGAGPDRGGGGGRGDAGDDAATAVSEGRAEGLPAGNALTEREVEVLRLLVEGRSDKEIGATLFISHRTAMNHVARILDKLGVESRTAAATLAMRNGII